MHRDVYVWIQYYIQHTHAHTRMHTHTHAHNHTHTIHTHATHTHTITHSYDTHTGTHTHTQSHTHLLFERLLCLLLVSVQDVLQTLLVWSHGPQPFLCQLTCHLIPHLSWLGEGQKRGEEGQRESRGRRRDGSRDWLQPFNKSNLTLYLLLDVHVLNMHTHTHTHIYIYIYILSQEPRVMGSWLSVASPLLASGNSWVHWKAVVGCWYLWITVP